MNIGQKSPDFKLVDQNGLSFCLSEQIASSAVILVFYPYDQTPLCTKQLCEVNQDLDLFAKNGLNVLGINNAEAESHRDFAERQFLQMPLLSDVDYRVAKLYDCLWQIGPIRVIRRTVVGVDQEGTIRYYERGIPTNEQILTKFIGITKTLG